MSTNLSEFQIVATFWKQIMSDNQSQKQVNKKLHRLNKVTLILFSLLGILFVLFALSTDWVGLDITPGFGIVQMIALLLGITSLTIVVFLLLRSNRPVGAGKSLQADIGWRLAATGLLFVYVTGLADLIGIGTHTGPDFTRPFLGPLQLGGFALGVFIILLGTFLYYTSRGSRDNSSLKFLLKE